ncbi:hypothetical protein IG631_03514 [Alternaria alternata]|nr:hypothetical protein IG631_03514 [Alternaria alternata]
MPSSSPWSPKSAQSRSTFLLMRNGQTLISQKNSHVRSIYSTLASEATTNSAILSLVVPPRHIVTEFGSGEGWGSGSFVYLQFQVQDTGCGLSPQQMSLLFEKFAQAVGQSNEQATDELRTNAKSNT